MKSIKRFGALFGFILIASFPTVQAAPPASDDFNDNVKSPAWGDDIILSGSAVFLTETNAHLEFTGSTIGDSTIIRPWVAGMGSYTQNWEAAADVNLGSITVPDNSGFQMFLAVANSGDPSMGDHLSVALDLDQDSFSTDRTYIMEAAVDGTSLTAAPNYGEVFTANTNGRMRIAFDASTKILTASYNGNPLGLLDVDDAATSWAMTDGSSFMVLLGGSMWNNDANGYTNSSHEVYADNFILRTGSNLPYDLAVKNGSGSGAYTNGAKATITASNAPSGQVFDHWAGSVQYVASVTSAATTVTMPAQAITLTPSYKLTGTAIGDDFNDNVLNSNKWAEAMFLNGPFTNAFLTEINGRMEFTGNTEVVRPWLASYGSYTQSWEVAMDASLGTVALLENDAYVNMNLAVFNRQDTNLLNGVVPGDILNIALDLYRDWDGNLIRGYELTSRLNASELTTVPNCGYVSTADQQGRLKIAFDAATKVLTASYNGNVLGWVDVDAAGSNWEMTNFGTFGFAIAGGAGGVDISTGEVSADNFAAVGSIIPPEDENGNGLPDWWELQYFGGTVSNPSVICSNGLNTVLEAYIAGINPNDPDAYFGITGGDVMTKTFQWNAVSGRVYNVYWTTNLLNSFQPLQTNYTGGSITDSIHNAAGKCFYKIDVRLAQ